MRAVLAALLACLFVVMTVTDRVACPDGCTDEAPAQTATPHAAAPCALCLGWAPAPAHATPRPTDRVAADLPSLAARLLSPALPSIERPPKAA
jgi:hypothetical protein